MSQGGLALGLTVLVDSCERAHGEPPAAVGRQGRIRLALVGERPGECQVLVRRLLDSCDTALSGPRQRLELGSRIVSQGRVSFFDDWLPLTSEPGSVLRVCYEIVVVGPERRGVMFVDQHFRLETSDHLVAIDRVQAQAIREGRSEREALQLLTVPRVNPASPGLS